MASNLFERHSREQGVFKNERYLWPEFVPERLPHRDAEINSIVYALNPVTKGGKMHNLFLHGPTGTGKTACIKYVLSQLEEFSDRAKTHYINCFEYGTRHAVLASIASFIGAVIPRRGTAADEVFTQMVEKLKTLNYAPIVILDEADQLEKSGEHSALLYDILRVIEYQKNRIGLVLISNDAGFTSRLDERVRSSLSAEVIEFVPYSPVQMKDILRERCEQAFSESVLESDVINLAAAFAAKNGGDARVAIEALWKAGREAQREGSNTVSLKHLRRAMDTINFSRAPKEMKNLNEHEKKLLEIISQNPGIKSGELYEKYNDEMGENAVGERRLRNFVESIEEKKLVSSKEIDLGGRGRTREFNALVKVSP